METDCIRSALQQEMALSTGCTEVGCIALLTAAAARELGATPEKIDLTVSPNILKNGIHVFVPGSGMRGLRIAAALGSVIRNPEAGLSVLAHFSASELAAAQALVAQGRVEVAVAETKELIYAHARLEQGGHVVTATLGGGHQNITRITKDGQVCFSGGAAHVETEETQYHFRGYGAADLITLALEQEPAAYLFLWEAAQTNYRAAQAGFQNSPAVLGNALQNMQGQLPQPYAAIQQAQLWSSAASEARMGGLPVPVMSIAGSGNHGIANFLGMYMTGVSLHASQDKIIQALILSSMLTIYVKEYTGRVTAYCGSALAPAAGVAAGTVFLLGGSLQTMLAAMQTLLGTYAGILCDGAKESCAYKVSRGVSAGVEAAFLAMNAAAIPPVNGIVGHTLEETLENLEQLNDPGMCETDRVVLEMIRAASA